LEAKMNRPTNAFAASVRFRPGAAAVRLAVLAAAAGWLAALGGLIGTLKLVPDIQWPAIIFPLLLCGSAPAAWWATRRATTLRRVWLGAPDALLERRHHGDLSALVRTAPRSLRPIGTTVDEVAECTDTLLADLAAAPNVRIFRGVRPAGTALPLTGHAVSAGRSMILVESVAWPPGNYQMDADGRVRCDGQYIGQSVAALLTSVRQVRRRLPRRHRVSGLVVVHRTEDGRYALPAASDGLAWTLAEDAPARLRHRLARDPVTVSRHAVAALCWDTDSQVVPG
jgi:hypothetical protein